MLSPVSSPTSVWMRSARIAPRVWMPTIASASEAFFSTISCAIRTSVRRRSSRSSTTFSALLTRAPSWSLRTGLKEPTRSRLAGDSAGAGGDSAACGTSRSLRSARSAMIGGLSATAHPDAAPAGPRPRAAARDRPRRERRDRPAQRGRVPVRRRRRARSFARQQRRGRRRRAAPRRTDLVVPLPQGAPRARRPGPARARPSTSRASGWPTGPSDFDYSWSGLAAWTGEAIDALGLDRVHLVVHDIGGPIGFEWAIRNPDRVLSVTVLNTLVDVGELPPAVADAPVLDPGHRRGLASRVARGSSSRRSSTRWGSRIARASRAPRSTRTSRCFACATAAGRSSRSCAASS